MGLICNLQHNITVTDPITVYYISLQTIQEKNSVSVFPKFTAEHRVT